jgi:hypothetical protein
MNRSTSLLAIVLVGGCLVSAAAAEKVEWKKADGGNGHFYEVVAVPEGISFVDAQLAAEKKGGHLATILSKEENEFVFKLADDEKYWGTDEYNGYGPWLGGYQDGEATDPAKDWNWITGEPWKYANWNTSSGEPNDSGDRVEDHTEDYLHFFCYGSTGREARWNDSANGAPYIVGYVIEWTPKEELPAKKAESKPAEAQPTNQSTESSESTNTSNPTDSGDAG